MVLQDTIQVELTQIAGGETRVDKTKSRHFYLKVNAKALMDLFIMHPVLLFLLHMGLSPSDLYHTLF